MEIEQIKEIANKELGDALGCCGMNNPFKVILGGTLSEWPGNKSEI